ncbi:MAG: hypothetical protein ABIT38_03965 [Gemmatimonadaceae bacterium]
MPEVGMPPATLMASVSATHSASYRRQYSAIWEYHGMKCCANTMGAFDGGPSAPQQPSLGAAVLNSLGRVSQ